MDALIQMSKAELENKLLESQIATNESVNKTNKAQLAPVFSTGIFTFISL